MNDDEISTLLIAELERTVEVFGKHGGTRIVLQNTPEGYPIDEIEVTGVKGQGYWITKYIHDGIINDLVLGDYSVVDTLVPRIDPEFTCLTALPALPGENHISLGLAVCMRNTLASMSLYDLLSERIDNKTNPVLSIKPSAGKARVHVSYNLVIACNRNVEYKHSTFELSEVLGKLVVL